MSTSKEYLAYVLDQLSPLEGITHRMMMGEYILYYRGKIAAYICDDRFLVKPVPSVLRLLPDAEYDAICEGGRKKLIRVDDVDNRELLLRLFREMFEEFPEPKPKKKKTEKSHPMSLTDNCYSQIYHRKEKS